MNNEIITQLQIVISMVNVALKSTVSINDKAELESILSDLFRIETNLRVYERKVASR